MADPQDQDGLDGARAAIQAAWRASERAVHSAVTAQEAYDLATSLRAAFREASDEMARLRARAAARIREEESLALVPLAKRLGVSTTRAHQLMQLARDGSDGKERTDE